MVEILFSSLMCFSCALVAVVAFDFQFSHYNKSLYKVTFVELSLQKVEKKFQKQKVDNRLVHVRLYVIFVRYFGMMLRNFGMKIYYDFSQFFVKFINLRQINKIKT